MPIFAALVGSLLSSLAGFFAVEVTKKIAFALAAIAVFSAFTVALMIAITTAINAAIATMSSLPAGVLSGMAIFFPSNLPACASLIFATHAAIAVYRWNVENVRMFLQSA